MTSPGDADRADSMTDGQLDALLGAANDELLEHVQATADPSRALVAIMVQGTRPGSRHDANAGRAASLIAARLHATALTRVLFRARDLARELDSGTHFDDDGYLAETRGPKLARQLDAASNLAHELARDLDSSQARRLALDLFAARCLALNLDGNFPGARERTSALTCYIDRHLSHIRAFAQALMEQSPDVSGADLSDLDIREVGVLDRVVWTAQTTWPPGIAGRVREHSRETRDGVYQVRIGRSPDRDTILRS